MVPRELLAVFDGATEPAANLAAEERLFELVQRGELSDLVRFWRNSTCLVKGRAKSKNYGWYDERLAARLGVPVYERSTGGGVVYMDLGNLNWSFFAKASTGLTSPTALFERWSGPVVRALRGAGFDASFARPNRLDVSGRKVSGMAARIARGALLVHGTLLVDADLRRLNSLCIPPPGCPPVANLREWSSEVGVDGVERRLLVELRLSGYEVRETRTLPPT